MKIALLSNHFSGAIKLNYLLRNNVEIDTIITLVGDRAKEHKVAGYHDFSSDIEKNIKIYNCHQFDLKSDVDLAFFAKEKFDILLIGGWQRIVPDQVLKLLNWGAVAEHGSSEELPRGRGRSPINWSIISGRERFIVNLFKAMPGADNGPVLARHSVEITPFDTVRTIYFKVGIVTAQLTIDLLPKIKSGSIQFLSQDEKKATYYPKRADADDQIDWNWSTKQICNLVRAITAPYPAAKTEFRGKTVRFLKAQAFDSYIWFDNLSPGQVAEVFLDQTFLVKTVDGSILVTEARFNDGSIALFSVGDQFFKSSADGL